MIKRHFACIDSPNIDEDHFLTMESLLRHTKTYLSLQKKHGRKIVYLMTFNADSDNNAIMVDEDADVMIKFIDSGIFEMDNITDVFLQEYVSYESAYSVALGMREISELCYDANNAQKN